MKSSVRNFEGLVQVLGIVGAGAKVRSCHFRNYPTQHTLHHPDYLVQWQTSNWSGIGWDVGMRKSWWQPDRRGRSWKATHVKGRRTNTPWWRYVARSRCFKPQTSRGPLTPSRTLTQSGCDIWFARARSWPTKAGKMNWLPTNNAVPSRMRNIWCRKIHFGTTYQIWRYGGRRIHTTFEKAASYDSIKRMMQARPGFYSHHNRT